MRTPLAPMRAPFASVATILRIHLVEAERCGRLSCREHAQGRELSVCVCYKILSKGHKGARMPEIACAARAGVDIDVVTADGWAR